MSEQPIFQQKNLSQLKPEQKEDLILSKIEFKEEEYTSGPKRGQKVYKSSSTDRSRKMAILEENSPIIPESKYTYDVEIVHDSKPDKPMKGFFTVKIVKTYENGVPIEQEIKQEPDILTPISIDHEAKEAFFLDVKVDVVGKKTALVPNKEEFADFCIDEKTALVLRKIAEAYMHRTPCLLEGATSTSKTSSIKFLSMVTGNEVERMNLNGQTDTSELIGKFVPNDGDLQLTFENAVKNFKDMPADAKEILQRANKEARGLNKEESIAIGKLLGIEATEWVWHDGVVPRCMKEGRICLLDELNLADQSVIARLNSVSEENPSLVLTENGGEKIGPGGDYEVDPNFWLTATQNPSEYEGRRPLSSAERDRFGVQIIVPIPNFKQYAQMMSLMVYGNQPNFEVDGVEYEGGEYAPKFDNLADIPNMAGFLDKLSLFQEAIEKSAREGEIGKNKQEPYIFTRRGLINFMRYLSTMEFYRGKKREKINIQNDPKAIILRAIELYFLGRLYQDDQEDLEDLKKVKDLLEANGIGIGKDAAGKDKFKHEFTVAAERKSSSGTP